MNLSDAVDVRIGDTSALRVYRGETLVYDSAEFEETVLLSDDFSGTLSKWTPGAFASASGGLLVLKPEFDYDGFVRSSPVAAAEVTATVELVRAANNYGASVMIGCETYATIQLGNSYIGFDFYDGRIECYSSMPYQTLFWTNYNPTAHRWLRIVVAEGLPVTWQVSPDGVSWTTMRSQTVTTDMPPDYSDITFVLGAGYYGESSPTETTLFDNVRLTVP